MFPVFLLGTETLGSKKKHFDGLSPQGGRFRVESTFNFFLKLMYKNMSKKLEKNNKTMVKKKTLVHIREVLKKNKKKYGFYPQWGGGGFLSESTFHVFFSFNVKKYV